MHKISYSPTAFILCLSVFLALFRFSAYSFKYTPYLDDYVQYFYYPTFEDPWQTILLGGPGVLFTRPLAGLFDRFFWSLFADNLALAQLFISVLHGISGILFFKALDALGLQPSSLFLVLYLLTPVNSEGTYWLSASTRIVVSMFLTAAAAFSLTKKKTALFAVLQFLSLWFYEQTAVLSFFLSIIICIMTKQYKKMAFPVLSMLLLALFYLFCGKLGDNAARLTPISPQNFFIQAADTSKQLYRFLPLSLQLTAKGFLRGMDLIASQRLWIWLCLLLISAALFLAASEKTAFHSTFKKSAMGILLTAVPFIPFFISADAGLNFRNIVPALLGISLIFEDLIIRFFRRLTPAVGAAAVIVFSVAALTDVTDYNFTAAQDLKIAMKIAEQLPTDAQSITCKISTPDYYPQSAPVGDHIKSMTASDWGATGIVRTLTGNKEVTVTLINSP